MNNKLRHEPAFPLPDHGLGILSQGKTTNGLGISKRFYAVCKAKNDFDGFTLLLQERIVGRKVPRSVTKFTNRIANIDVESLEYASWLAEGRTKWLYMQADELLKQEDNDTNN